MARLEPLSSTQEERASRYTCAEVRDMRMPTWTDRLHLMPYWLGDSPKAIAKAAKMPVGADGGRYVDINLQHTADGDVCMHWGTARKGGWAYIQVAPGIRRKMTEDELDRPIQKWKTTDVMKWRRTRLAGPKYVSRVRPISYLAMVDLCKAKGVTPTFELKSNAYAFRPVARHLVLQAKQRGAHVYYMALITMPLCRQKCAAIVVAGGEFAVLAHNYPKPADFHTWSPQPTRVWGRWARP